MARIKHPDTFTCDLCGAELTEDEVSRVRAPFISTMVATEHGTKVKDEFEYRTREFDLCDACAYRVVAIHEVPRFFHESEFEFRDDYELVTRCRDCKYIELGLYSPKCGFLGLGTSPDGFCAWGERRGE